MKIVVLDGQTLNPGDNPWTPIEALGELQVYPRTEIEQLVERAASADILLTNKAPLRESSLQQLPELKMVSVLATGYDVVDVDAAAKRNIVVCNVPVYSTNSVAQHVFAGLLSFLHRPGQHDQAIRAGKWEACRDFSFSLLTLRELAGKTMGIVGFGRIGKSVARLASAFGMRVIAHTRSEQELPRLSDFRFVDSDELFEESDVISLNCPQTADTKGLVNKTSLSKMKPSVILINASRGGLVVEDDLAEALNQDRIGGAVLDVVSQEPMVPENPLLSAKNCLLTPHQAWATLEARQRLMQTTADNIRAFQQGQPINVVS